MEGIFLMRQLNKGEAVEGDTVYFKKTDGTFQESLVKFVEDRMFYNVLHTSKVMKNGRIVKRVATGSEDGFYVPE